MPVAATQPSQLAPSNGGLGLRSAAVGRQAAYARASWLDELLAIQPRSPQIAAHLRRAHRLRSWQTPPVPAAVGHHRLGYALVQPLGCRCPLPRLFCVPVMCFAKPIAGRSSIGGRLPARCRGVKAPDGQAALLVVTCT